MGGKLNYYIEIDHGRLLQTSTAINDYLEYTKNKMGEASREVKGLRASWSGNDLEEYDRIWDTIVNTDSTYMKMRNNMKNYADFLEYAANTYKNAQARAIQRSQYLIKF